MLPKIITCALLVFLLASPVAFARATAPLPLFAEEERVLFQGDSITDMNRGRTADPNHILGHGYAFLIAAQHGEAYPERATVFFNRGISGNTIADLTARWKTDTLDLHPDVLSVLIGINDVYFSFRNGKPISIPDLEKAYDQLLDSARAQNPKIKFILGEPFILPGKNNEGKWDDWRNAVIQMQAMTARVAERHHAAIIHYQQLFDEAMRRAPALYWIWDGVHPTFAGHQLMAEEWQRVYADTFIPQAPTAGENTALIPKPRIEHDSYDWYERHFAELEIQKTHFPEVVLIGDSITHFWSGEPKAHIRNGPQAWEQTFAGRSVLNFGFGWDRTQNVLWRLENGEMNGLTPKTIILNIGTNNLTGTKNARTNTPGEIAEAIAFICKKLRAEFPEAQLVVMGIFPRGNEANSPLRAPIKAINALLPDALNGISGVRFLDIGDKFLSADGTISKELMPDGTHPSDKGYEIWGRALLEAGVLNHN
jgi:lysophospholipase L1-like esterase